jgi:hypothetical protein
VLLYFGVDVVPTGTSLTVGNVAGLPAFLANSAASFAALLRVPPATLYAVNVTDLVTGRSQSVGVIRRRELGGAGSGGVSITYVVRLGKTPVQYTVINMTATLSSPALMAPVLKQVATALASAAGLPASLFSVSAPASELVLANAPFSIAEPSAAAAAWRAAAFAAAGIWCAVCARGSALPSGVARAAARKAVRARSSAMPEIATLQRTTVRRSKLVWLRPSGS